MVMAKVILAEGLPVPSADKMTTASINAPVK